MVVPRWKERGERVEWAKPLPDGKDAIPLAESGIFHRFQIQVRRDRATIRIDKCDPMDITLAWLRQHDRQAAERLDFRGAVGVWAIKGGGEFQNASIILIDDE